MDVARAFEVERIGPTVVLNLRRGVDEIEFDQPPPDVDQLLELLGDIGVKALVVDCHEIDFLRSTALGFFVTLWQKVKPRGGRLVFCNTSAKAREVLGTTKLDRVWTVCATRADAMAQVGETTR